MTLRPSICTSFSRNIAISLLLFGAVMAVGAQGSRSRQEAQERLRQQQMDDSIPLYRGFQVKADLVGLIQRAVSDYGQLEAGVRVNLKDKYFPTVELGLGTADHHDIVTQTGYKTSAPYLKMGVDFNIMKNKHDIYRVYAGARYALTYFKFDLSHPDLIDPVWGGRSPFRFASIKANCHWLELLAGVDARIWGPVHLGWTARYQRRLVHNDGSLGNTWYVPGFGKQGGSRIGGTFELMLEF